MQVMSVSIFGISMAKRLFWIKTVFFGIKKIGPKRSKLHAFGPMGLEELTSTKFIVHGNGQIRSGSPVGS
jgi:hypothetical protein